MGGVAGRRRVRPMRISPANSPAARSPAAGLPADSPGDFPRGGFHRRLHPMGVPPRRVLPASSPAADPHGECPIGGPPRLIPPGISPASSSAAADFPGEFPLGGFPRRSLAPCAEIVSGNRIRRSPAFPEIPWGSMRLAVDPTRLSMGHFTQVLVVFADIRTFPTRPGIISPYRRVFARKPNPAIAGISRDSTNAISDWPPIRPA